MDFVLLSGRPPRFGRRIQSQEPRPVSRQRRETGLWIPLTIFWPQAYPRHGGESHEETALSQSSGEHSLCTGCSPSSFAQALRPCGMAGRHESAAPRIQLVRSSSTQPPSFSLAGTSLALFCKMGLCPLPLQLSSGMAHDGASEFKHGRSQRRPPNASGSHAQPEELPASSPSEIRASSPLCAWFALSCGALLYVIFLLAGGSCLAAKQFNAAHVPLGHADFSHVLDPLNRLTKSEVSKLNLKCKEQKSTAHVVASLQLCAQRFWIAVLSWIAMAAEGPCS